MYWHRQALDSFHDLRCDLHLVLQRRGVPPDVVRDVVLATQEACNNAVQYGDDADGVEVCVTVHERAVIVEVSDRGPGFDMERVKAGWPPRAHCSGGRGLFLISHVADSLEVVRRDRGTLVRITKSLGAAEAGVRHTSVVPEKGVP
jgi:serine/threonine-protein kinase RsbW